MADKQARPEPQSARRNTNDALDKDGHVIPAKLHENQQKLNVGTDHKTPDMKKRHRSTFP